MFNIVFIQRNHQEMDQAIIRHYFEKRLDRIADKCSKLSPAFDAGTIHKLRTETKKLRSLMRLVNEQAGTELIKLPGGFRKIYKAAGHIRDAQLQIQMLVERNDVSPLSGFSLWLVARIMEGAQKWDKVCDKAIITELTEDIEKTDLPDLMIADLQAFYSKRITDIGQGIGMKPDDEALHAIRKQIKDMQYLSAWCEKHWPEAAQAVQSYGADKLKTLSERAGNYNDISFAISMLETYMQEEQDAAILQGAVAMKKEWKKEKTKERSRLMTAIRSYVKATLNAPAV